MEITAVRFTEIEQVMAIELAGFSAAEAGTRTQYLERIAQFTDTFLVARAGEKVIGFICGPAVAEKELADWMYERAPKNLPVGGNQMILTIAVAPQWQKKHVGSQLLLALEEVARQKERQQIILTCLASRISFYKRNGYYNAGVSASQHAGERWYTMKKDLNLLQSVREVASMQPKKD